MSSIYDVIILGLIQKSNTPRIKCQLVLVSVVRYFGFRNRRNNIFAVLLLVAK